MKKVFFFALFLLSLNAMGQPILNRFKDPENKKAVFVPKGYRAIGISGSYRSINAGGDVLGDGYAVLSLLNIGGGQLSTYNVSPKFSIFIADDVALGFRLDYSGLTLNTDLRLDLRSLVDLSEAVEDPEEREQINELLNLRISGRHMVRNTWGLSVTLRKYIPFFGSQTFAVFGEARLYGNYGRINSCPIDEKGAQMTAKMRNTDVYSAGLKIAGGLCVRLKDNSALTVSVPLIGACYDYTQQHKEVTNNNAHLSEFKIARNLDFMGIQVGYMHYIKSKKK